MTALTDGDWFPSTSVDLRRAGEGLVVTLIVVNATAVILGTVDSLAVRYGFVFRSIEHLSVAVFSVELVARVARRTARGDRVERLADPYLLVDVVAVLPFYVGVALGVGGFGFLSFVRILRLFKLARYFDAFDVLARILRRKESELAASTVGTLLLLVVAATGIYFAEHGAQPEAFPNVPAALWWAGVTITTVGYGDVVPVTAAGRILGVAVSLLGVGIAAVPASILVWGFIEEARHEFETAGPPEGSPDHGGGAARHGRAGGHPARPGRPREGPAGSADEPTGPGRRCPRCGGSLDE